MIYMKIEVECDHANCTKRAKAWVEVDHTGRIVDLTSDLPEEMVTVHTAMDIVEVWCRSHDRTRYGP